MSTCQVLGLGLEGPGPVNNTAFGGFISSDRTEGIVPRTHTRPPALAASSAADILKFKIYDKYLKR